MQNLVPVLAVDGIWLPQDNLPSLIPEILKNYKLEVEVINHRMVETPPESFDPVEDVLTESEKYEALQSIWDKEQKPDLVVVYRSWLGYLAGYHYRGIMGFEKTLWGEKLKMPEKEKYWDDPSKKKIVPDHLLYLNGCIDPDSCGFDCVDQHCFAAAATYLLNEFGFVKKKYPDLKVSTIDMYDRLESVVIPRILGWLEERRNVLSLTRQ